jgi:hypothetical protein
MKDEKFELTIESPALSEREHHYGAEDGSQIGTSEYNGAPSRSDLRWPASVDETKLLRKIDWSIIPILMAAYFLQFLDKVIYNVGGPCES